MVESNPGERAPRAFHPSTVILRQIAEMGRAFERSLEDQLVVNPTDREAMEHLISRGPLSAGELAKAIDHSPAGTTAVIDRLERVGHVTREPDPTDRRKTRIVASQASADRARSILFGLARSIDEVAHSLTPEQQAVVQKYLEDVATTYRTALGSYEELAATTDPG